MKRLSLALAFVFACSSPPPEEDCRGLSCPEPQPDLGRPPGTVDPNCSAPRGALRKTVVERLIMPTVNLPCSIDVDGDGRLDNALSAAAAGLRAVAFDLQANADSVIRTGALLQLLTLQTEDAMNSGCASVRLERGMAPRDPPAFDGTDTFQVDRAIPATQLYGTISMGQFETARPVDQPATMVVRLGLSLPGGFGIEVPLPLLGAHLSARARQESLVSGELHGVVRVSDVEGHMIPAIAKVMTALIRKMPDAQTAKQLIAHFETRAKCDVTPNLCCKQRPQTCEITAEEVQQNPQMRLILKPDVQMFSGERWAPRPAGDVPDSLSVGICFTAVSAVF